uniref:Uncharacterized protein n=1 Tax=Megaselia scalaris TaxID=36166 RepID=T1H3U3_MEGSC
MRKATYEFLGQQERKRPKEWRDAEYDMAADMDTACNLRNYKCNLYVNYRSIRFRLINSCIPTIHGFSVLFASWGRQLL